MKAKFLSVLLALTMVLSLLPTAVLAVDVQSNEKTQAVRTVSLPEGNTGDFTIDSDNAVLDGTDVTYMNGTITVTGDNVTIQNLTFGDKAKLVVNTTGKFTLNNCAFAPETAYDNNGFVRNPVKLNVGEAVVTNNTFAGVENGYYNAIEFGIGANEHNLSAATISGNKFNSAIKNNYFSFYNMTDNAVINIRDNQLLNSSKASDGVRISNPNNASATFNIINNTFTYSDSGSNYDALILFQDYSNGQNFNFITLNIEKLSAPQDITTLYYVYQDGTGVITTNQPKITGDSSIEKFFVAKVGTAMYSSLSDAVAAAGTGDTVTLVKDSSEAVTITKKITLTAAKDVTFSGSLTFEPDSEGSEVDGVRFENNGGARKVADIVTIKAPNITVQNCKFTVPSAVWDYNAQLNCIKIQCTSGAVIDNNTFYLGRIQDSYGSNPTAPVNGHSNVAINVVGPKVTNVTILNNHLYATEPSTSLAVGNTSEATKKLSASVNMIIAIGNGNSAYGIDGLTIQGNTVDGSNDSVNTRFAGLSNVNAFVVEKNSILNAGVGTYQVYYRDTTFMNHPESISGNTYTGMTSDNITLASAARKSGDTWTDYNSVRDAVSAVQPGDKVIDRHSTSADKVTVTLKYNEDSDNDAEISIVKGTAITLPTPTRSGRYTFLYWTDGTDTYDAGDAYTVTGSATLNAVWRHIGSGSSSSSGSSITVGKTENGTITVSPATASKGTNVTITVKPADGYELGSLTATDANGSTLALTDLGNGKYSFTMPDGKVEVSGTFVKKSAQTFVDVPENAYYAPAVNWAVEKGVTEGTSATTFSPDAACTRAQIVTFLYRAAGSPAVKSTVNPFTDVSASDYYYNAVLWAVENGITTGTSETTFSPNESCTRAQCVTFLYRAVGSAATAKASFTDVSADAYYAPAVDWAVEKGVTTGTSATTFSPDDACTRAQIVTFLYRAAQVK